MKDVKGLVIEIVENFMNFIGKVLVISEDRKEITIKSSENTNGIRKFRVTEPVQMEKGDYVFVSPNGVMSFDDSELKDVIKELNKDQPMTDRETGETILVPGGHYNLERIKSL
jgi:hypothetical protein